MTTASISQAKNHLSALVEKVRHGETVVLLDRKRAVAKIVPVGARPTKDEEGRWLAECERIGLLKRGTGVIPRRILEEAPPKALVPGSALASLLKEREEGP